MSQATERSVAGRYSLRVSIGRGGMGTVWRAYDEVLQREVAVKEVRLPASVPDEQREAARARVLREGRAAARLNHPNVVTVYDVIAEDDRAFVVMELVDAPTLEQRVREHGPLPPTEAARIALEMLDALEAAHREGITHRDVKPANVMLLDDGRIKLADFGIASVKDDPRLTSTGLILGSPSYMSPEQASEATVGPATDMWALGATLFFMLEGKGPFDRGQPIPTLAAVVHDQAPAPRRAGPLAAVVDGLLAKDPAARPDIATARRMLRAATAGTEVATGTFEAAHTPEEIAEPAEPAAQPRPAGRAPRPMRGWAWALALLAVLAVALALVLPRLGDPPTAGSEPAPRSRAKGNGASAPATGGGGTPSQEGYETYEDPSAGWSIEHPSGWVAEPGSVDGDSVDLTDPGTGAYMRVDWTDAPGPDAVAAARSQEEAFASTHEGYEQVRLEPTTFAGSDNAVMWEYVYSDGGATLHAYNLQFVLADGSYGFALNFQTPEDAWEASQGVWEAMSASFRAPDMS